MLSAVATPSLRRFPNGRLRSLLRRPRAATSEVGLERFPLGASDLKVTEICLGCMMFGSRNTEAESHEIMSAAYEMGVNFLDTAEIYSIPPDPKSTGRSSRYVGSWLKTSGVKREDVVIATKVSGYGPAERVGFVAAARTEPPSAPYDLRLDARSIEAAVDGELRRLGTDYIDLMQTHWPDRYVPSFGSVFYEEQKERDSVAFEETIAAMADMIAKGKIRHWGLSNETSYGTTMICQLADQMNSPRPISIQNSYSLLDRNFESELAEVCCKRHFNLPLLPWSPAAGGVLSGKYLDGQFPEGSRMSTQGDRYGRFVTGRVAEATAAYAKLARENGYSPIQMAYLFCKSRFFVGSTVIGATSLEQLREDVGRFGEDLSEDLQNEINGIHAVYPNPQNTYPPGTVF